MRTKVAVLFSGGVDSSVALARITARRDLLPTAFYLKIWLEKDLDFLGRCPWEDDLLLVRSVCLQLGVPMVTLSLQREYREEIVEYSLKELKAGRTPSSDVLCNRLIKFGAFSDAVGTEYPLIASGHYARTHRDRQGTHLLKGVDRVKDQSYFLCRMRQGQLSRCLFPIGDTPKLQIRREARELGLASADRPDSQGICFLGKIPYRDFVEYHLGRSPGKIVESESGEILGTHRGLWFYTIGQRRGLGLAGGPWYVVAKQPEDGTLFVTHQKNLHRHERRFFRIEDPNWICAPPGDGAYDIRLRHGERLWPGNIRQLPNGDIDVELTRGDPGIAAGQFAVIYSGEECLGGGPVA